MNLGSIGIWQIFALSNIAMPAVIFLTAKRKGLSIWLTLAGFAPIVNVLVGFVALLVPSEKPSGGRFG